MKRIIEQIVSLIVFSVGFSFPQWSNDPNNNLIVGYGADPHICSDSAGGCYITYRAGEPTELFLRRLDKYGYQPWGYKKQILGELTEQWQAEIIEDGEGGVIVSYEDMEDNLPVSFTARVRVQRVDSSGNFLWGSTGVNVSLDSADQGLQQLVTDGDGGCVITWVNVPFTYHVNRIDKNGNRLWGDNGIMLGTSAYNSHPRIIRATDGNYYVETGEFIYRIKQNSEFTLWNSSNDWWIIVAAPEGGGILHSAIWSPTHYILLAQRKDSLGNNLWQEPYVEIADSLYMSTVLMFQKNNGYFYYGWSGNKNGIERVAQFQALRLDGSKLFTQGSISISNRSPLAISNVFPSDSSRMIFVWGNRAHLPDTTLAQIYDTLGNKLWNENGIVIAHPSIGSQGITTDGNGGFIVGGIIDNFTIVAQQVNKYGRLGEVITNVNIEDNNSIPTETVLYQNYPNPFNPVTIIKYSLPKAGDVSLIIYDILGGEVKELVNAKQQAGRYEVKWDASKVANGVYIYQLSLSSFVNSKKMILLK